MRHRLFTLPLAVGLSLSLTGCSQLPQPREMGDMALLRTMGVDRTGNETAVTVSTGPRAKGLQGDREDALVLAAGGASISAAALALQNLSDSYVFFGYVDQLLLGEELARQNVGPVLDHFAQSREMSPGAGVWVVRGDSAAHAVSSGDGQGVESRLATLRTDGEMGVASISRTAGEVYTDLLEWGCAYLPALTVGQDESAALLDGGYAVLKDGVLAGFLEGEAARGLELLAGRPAAEILEARLSDEDVNVRVTGAETKCTFQQNGLEIVCRVTVRLTGHRQPLTREEMSRLKEDLAVQETARLEAALERLRFWQADCVGLGPKAALTAPDQWQRLAPNWPDRFQTDAPSLRLELAVQ